MKKCLYQSMTKPRKYDIKLLLDTLYYCLHTR